MLDIKFYSKADNTIEIIDVGDSCYECLIKSGFAKIGISKKTTVSEDTEKIEVSAIALDIETRKEFVDFFRDLIVQECNTMFGKLPTSPSIKEYEQALYTLKTLNSLYKTVGDERYYYLNRENDC